MKKKVIFWLSADYTHYCLAYALQRKYDCEMYGIPEVTGKPRQFFEKQKLVNFKKNLYLHDHIKNDHNQVDMEYLVQFEKKYKIDLWKLIQNERIFLYFKNFHEFTSKEMLSILEQECRFFEDVLEKIKPDMLFIKIPALHHQELFYQMCKNTGVFVQILTFAPIGYYSMLTEDLSKLDHIENVKDKNRSFEELQNFLYKFDLSKNIRDTSLKSENNVSNILKSAGSFIFNSDSKNTRTHYTYYGRSKPKVLFFHLKDILLTKFRESHLNKISKKEIDHLEQFVYFPLHVEIERTLLIGAPFYLNQIEIIKSVAKSLPINFKLYVKEHPSQVLRAWRSSSEYKQIMDIPNVVLLHPNVSQKELCEKCSLVFTIAGTTGFEASFYGKPVIIFTDQYYSLLPSVRVLKNLEELPRMIRESLTEKIGPSDLDKLVSLVEENICKFDYADFEMRYRNEFFYGGNLYDVEISESKMKSFLEKNIDTLNVLADEHVKKIKRRYGHKNSF